MVSQADNIIYIDVAEKLMSTLIDQVVIFLNLLFSTFIFYSGMTDMYTMEYTTVSSSCSPTFLKKKEDYV